MKCNPSYSPQQIFLYNRVPRTRCPPSCLLFFYRILYKVSFRVSGAPGILLAKSRSVPCFLAPSHTAPSWCSWPNWLPGATLREQSSHPSAQGHSCRRVAVWLSYNRAFPCPSAALCLSLKEEERGGPGKWMSALQDSPQRKETGYQAWARQSPALGQTPMPQAPGITPLTCFSKVLPHILAGSLEGRRHSMAG